MKLFFILTSIIEAPVGAALLYSPSLVSILLLGTALESPAAIVLGRVCGAAIFALAISCWQGRDQISTPSGRGLILAMLFYNLCAASILATSGVFGQPSGIGLWPAVLLHVAMAVWCTIGLVSRLKAHG